MTQAIARIVAVGLACPVILLIWWPAIYVWYAPEEQDIAIMAFLFRLCVIGLAIVAFAKLPAQASLIRIAPGFLVFPIAALLNPFDLFWRTSGRSYCPVEACAGTSWTKVMLELLRASAPLALIEIAAFAVLFVLVRIAAGKLWPGRVSADL